MRGCNRLREQFAIDVQSSGAHAKTVEVVSCVQDRFAGDPMTVLLVQSDRMGDPFRQHPHVARREEPTRISVPNDFTAGAVIGGDNWPAHRLGFDHDTAKAFRVG